MHDLTEQLTVHAVAEDQAEYRVKGISVSSRKDMQRVIAELDKQMKEAAKNLEFEKAAVLRDQIFELRKIIAEELNVPPWSRSLSFCPVRKNDVPHDRTVPQIGAQLQ